MAIDYIEILDKDRKLIGIIDTAKSIIWKSEYYGTGDFEIYVSATPKIVALIRDGQYAARPNDVNVGVIEDVEITYSARDGRMILVSGRFAKSILGRRLIYKLGVSGASIEPVISSGLVEVAVRKLVQTQIISPDLPARKISFIGLGPIKDIPQKIVDADGEAARKQTSYANLLTYTDELLQEYGLGAYMSLDRGSGTLLYNVFAGKDRSVGNADGNKPIIFSQAFDNLLSSTYKHQTETYKNMALIGGEGEGIDRVIAYVGESMAGMDRREVWVDASGQSRTYTDEDTGEETTYFLWEYVPLLQAAGRQQLEQLKEINTFDGEVDVSRIGLEYGTEYWIGDIVTRQDDDLGISANARIVSVIETQDESGYNISISFGI